MRKGRIHYKTECKQKGETVCIVADLFTVDTYGSIMQKLKNNPDSPKKLITICLATVGLFAIILISQTINGYKISPLKLGMPGNITEL